jgi:hypothetical protein
VYYPAIWSSVVYLYDQRKTGVPDELRKEFSDFKRGFKNYRAQVRAIVGGDAEGKEAISRKGIIAIQKMALNRTYTKASQDHWAPLTGALATNLGCRIHFCTNISLPNVSWKVCT